MCCFIESYSRICFVLRSLGMQAVFYCRAHTCRVEWDGVVRKQAENSQEQSGRCACCLFSLLFGLREAC